MTLNLSGSWDGPPFVVLLPVMGASVRWVDLDGSGFDHEWPGTLTLWVIWHLFFLVLQENSQITPQTILPLFSSHVGFLYLSPNPDKPDSSVCSNQTHQFAHTQEFWPGDLVCCTDWIVLSNNGHHLGLVGQPAAEWSETLVCSVCSPPCVLAVSPNSTPW